jgi:hypothetical protein
MPSDHVPHSVSPSVSPGVSSEKKVIRGLEGPHLKGKKTFSKICAVELRQVNTTILNMHTQHADPKHAHELRQVNTTILNMHTQHAEDMDTHVDPKHAPTRRS